MQVKKCSKCKLEFPATPEYFHRHKRMRDGLASVCKSCRALPVEPVNDPSILKLCTRCETEYPATTQYFHRTRRESDGLRSICKNCRVNLPISYSNEPTLLKKCSKCGIEYPQTDEYFQPHRESRDGFIGYCRSCGREDCKQYHLRNRERDLERNKDYYRHHIASIRIRSGKYRSENHQEILERRRKHYADNPEKFREWSRQWRENNPDKKRESARLYRISNPHVDIIISHKRRTRLKNLPSDFSEADWKSVLSHWKNRCAFCGKQSMLQIDHYIPLSNSECPGTILRNIVPACKSCNSSKNDSEAHSWMIRKFGSDQAAIIETNIMAYFDSITDR